MPQHKDLKRKVRSRMAKTGESYTAARSRLLAKKNPSSPSASALSPAPPAAGVEPPAAAPDYAALAGISDAAVEAKTGWGWRRWVETLDYAGAAGWSHREIARHLQAVHGVSDWWAQTVTVGYERIKGLREIGQRRTGAFEANKSRTFPVPLGVLYQAWADDRQRRRWLPEPGLAVRKATDCRSMRVTWPDGTSVELGFFAKGEAKSSVQIQHSKLASREDADGRKAYWAERLEALASLLNGEHGGTRVR